MSIDELKVGWLCVGSKSERGDDGQGRTGVAIVSVRLSSLILLAHPIIPLRVLDSGNSSCSTLLCFTQQLHI